MSEPRHALKASQSFSPDEVGVLDAIFSTLLRGGDAGVLIRSKAAAATYRKIVVMRNSIARQSAALALGKSAGEEP